MRACRLLAIFAAVSLAGGHAFARAPRAAEMPSVEDIYVEAKKAIEEEAKKKEKESHDTTKETIDAYRDGKTPLEEYGPLVDVIRNDKDEKVQFYRQTAQQALRERFSHEREQDPHVRQVRRDLADKLIPLMKAPDKDELGLRMIEGILYEWWRQAMLKIQFRASDKLSKRTAAWEKMKKFLDKEN